MSEIIKQQDTRREFIDVLCELAENDDKVLLILCDTGFNYVNAFQEKFPKQIYNFGVTEQSTAIICAAMALSGMKPYFYSMIPFVAFRPFEMIRNAIHCHKANVKLLGTKGSEKYKMLGFSHNMIFENEDEYHLKPYVKCYLPQTNEDVRNTILETYQNKEAAYIRL